jgi:hypothetical protein
MSTGRRFLAKALLVGTVLTMSLLVLSPSPALAEKSVHKLKKRLHKAEHNTSAVLCNVGQLVGDVLSNITLEVSFDCADDDDSESSPASPKASKATPESAHQAHTTKPSKPAHPAK